MGLFDIFKSKPTSASIKDFIWMHHEDKMTGFKKLQDLYPQAIFLAWFEATQKEFEMLSSPQVSIKMAPKVLASQVKGKIVIFLERYPLRDKEVTLTQLWEAQEIIALSALEEPLFVKFGGGNIISLLEKLGSAPDELLHHPMISKSIENAQKKLQEHVRKELPASSAHEWFLKNLNVRF